VKIAHLLAAVAPPGVEFLAHLLDQPSNRPVPSVDAQLQARENFRIVVARGRMPPSVRPSMRQEDSRRPVWEFADRVQITWACWKHAGTAWLSQPRLADWGAMLSFRSLLRRQDRGQPRAAATGTL
jgi:hypothetical protein